MRPSASNDKFSLFLAGFVDLRNDRLVADDLGRVRAQYEAALQAGRGDSMTECCSNPPALEPTIFGLAARRGRA